MNDALNTEKNQTAIFYLSVNFITCEHINIIKKFSHNFKKIIIAIPKNNKSNYFLNAKEKKFVLQNNLEKLHNIETIIYLGNIFTFAKKYNTQIIIFSSNQEKEKLEKMQQNFQDNFKLITPQYLNLNKKSKNNSLSINTLLSNDILNIYKISHIPFIEKQLIEEKILGCFLIGLTGEIGSGKTYIADKIVNICKKQKIQCHNIELDYLGHDILEKLNSKYYQTLRQKLIKIFGNEISLDGNFIDRKILGKIVFNNPLLLKKLNKIMKDGIITRLQEIISKKRGIILINGALIAEFHMTAICNNNIVVTKTTKEQQYKRLLNRNYSKIQIKKRIESQCNTENKIKLLKNAIKTNHYGNIVQFDNNSPNTKNIKDLLEEIKKLFLIN